MTQAAFSFIGTEIVAVRVFSSLFPCSWSDLVLQIAAGEAKNPRRNLPKAIKRVYIRILLFYIGGTLIIGLLVPSNDPLLNLKATHGTAGASPFVIAIQRAGIKGLPSIINACLLTSAWSAASSDLYTSSRALCKFTSTTLTCLTHAFLLYIDGLAVVGNAPKIFARTSRKGLPYVAILTCSLFGGLSYMGINSGSGTVFGWFANMTAIAGLATWFGIAVTYIRFYKGFKAQGLDRSKLPYASALQPYAAWYAAFSCFFVCLFSGWSVFLKDSWNTATFVTNYIPFILFPIMYIGWKIKTRVPMVKPMDMDFITGLDEIEADTYDEPPPKNKMEAFWAWLVCLYFVHTESGRLLMVSLADVIYFCTYCCYC